MCVIFTMTLKKLKKVLKKRARPRRIRRKHIALGGSYPHRGRGRYGHSGPYFITRDPEKPPEVQKPPTMTEIMEGFEKFTKSSAGTTKWSLQSVGNAVAITKVVYDATSGAYAWKYPQEAAEQKAATKVKEEYGAMKGAVKAGGDVLEDMGKMAADTASALFGNSGKKATMADVNEYLKQYPNETFANVTDQTEHWEDFLKSKEYQTVPTPNQLTPVHHRLIGAVVAAPLLYGAGKARGALGF